MTASFIYADMYI